MAPRDTTMLRSLWNAALGCARLAGWSGADLDVDTLLARAVRATGIAEFGDPEFRVPMAILVEELAANAGADRAGRQLLSGLIGCALENRLYLGAALREHPEIGDVAVAAPLVIVGLPRTGTTLLQTALAAVPGLRTPLAWETRLPARPPALMSPRELARHRARTAREVRFVNRMSPALAGSHEIGAELPEECNPLLLTSMRALLLALYGCPRYEDWLYASGFRHAYDWHRPHLQALAWRQPPCTWVLKAPTHMASLAELLRVYPDVRVVFTHRDPVASTASTAGLNAALQKLASPSVDRRAVGTRALAMLRRMHSAAHAVRANWPASAPPYLDLDYATLAREPLATVRRILAHFGVAEPEGTGDAVLRALRALQRRRAPPARYTCAEFGIDEDDVREAFAAEYALVE
ncbi:MAG: sulfotransferase [Burkholderiales bacterium]